MVYGKMLPLASHLTLTGKMLPLASHLTLADFKCSLLLDFLAQQFNITLYHYKLTHLLLKSKVQGNLANIMPSI